jgi:hypothetical protein
LLDGAVDEKGQIKQDSDLMNLLKDVNDFSSMSEIQSMDWMKNMEVMMAQALNWSEGQGVLSTLHAGNKITFKDGEGKMRTGKVGEDGKVRETDSSGKETGRVFENVTWHGGNDFRTDETAKSIDDKTPKYPEWNSDLTEISKIKRTIK